MSQEAEDGRALHVLKFNFDFCGTYGPELNISPVGAFDLSIPGRATDQKAFL